VSKIDLNLPETSGEKSYFRSHGIVSAYAKNSLS
jgi:hypothetical protein